MATNDERVKLSQSQEVLLALREARSRIEMLERTHREPLAIVGMACRFPGHANTPEAFWELVAAGREASVQLPPKSFDGTPLARVVSDPNYVPLAFVIDEIEQFDAPFFGLLKSDAEVTDPQQRLALECCWEALERAGCDPKLHAGRVGVYAGAGLNRYLLHNLLGNSERVRADNFQFTIGNEKDYLATRIAYAFDLRGPCASVQSACSTSLVAVHLACQSLRRGECDLALAGGADIKVPQDIGYVHQNGGILSADGHCRPFDAAASGTVMGSGVGFVALRRLRDALADGDPIVAVIRGSAVTNDGSDKANFGAPGLSGQVAVISTALADAGVSANSIGYVETHGTGTHLGDPLELEALTRAFRGQTERQGFCRVGSVKANIGHLEAAAGVAGLIKAALALQQRALPPSINFTHANPEIPFASTPFYVDTMLTPWSNGGAGAEPLRAGVSSFGIGGTNAHVILEQAPEPHSEARAHGEQPPQLLVLSARSAAALARARANLALFLEQHPGCDIASVARTLHVGRRAFAHRCALVCASPSDAIAALRDAASARVAVGAAVFESDVRAARAGSGDAAELESLGRRWVEGEPIDWDSLAAAEPARRIALPTYPFERERCWIDLGPRATETALAPSEPSWRRLPFAQWFWEPRWVEAPIAACADDDGPGSWLVFSDASALARRIVERLRTDGRDVVEVTLGARWSAFESGNYELEPRNGAEYATLMEALSARGFTPSRVLHLWSRQGPGATTALAWWDLGYCSLLFVLQALLRQFPSVPVTLGVVTDRLCDISGTELTLPEKSALLGPCRVAPQEHPQLSVRCIDVALRAADSEVHANELDQCALQVLAEFGASAAPDRADTVLVAYRAARRWLRCFEPCPPTNSTTSLVRPGGVYLITGGLGGIGFVLARHLATVAGVSLIVVTASALPGPADLAHADPHRRRRARRAQTLERIAKRVLMLQVDVGDETAMRCALAEAEAQLGVVHGVIHAAGVPGDGMICRKDPASSAHVMRAKVLGTQTLDALFGDKQLDFFVACSSLASLLGGVGQVDYCGANAVLDAAAQRGRSSLRTIAIAWDAWSDVGMASEASGTPLDHPYFTRRFASERDATTVYAGELSADRWVVADHRLAGSAVLPGTAYLDLLVTTCAEAGALEVLDLVFLRPLTVADDAERELLLLLGPSLRSRTEREFCVVSRDPFGDDDDYVEHATGRLRTLEPLAITLDLTELRAACSERVPVPEAAPPAGPLRLGPRWQIAADVATGADSSLACLELPLELSADVDEYALHPALLDIATSFAAGAQDAFHLPLTYRRVRVYGRLPRRIYSHIRTRKGSPARAEILKFDVTLLDERGRVLVEIEDYALARVDLPDAAAVPASPKPHAPHSPVFQRLLDATQRGISATEGIAVFEHALAHARPELLVSLTDLAARLRASPGRPAQRSDRSAPERAALQLTAAGEPLEQQLIALWCELFGKADIGLDEDFFDDLQGTSLLATRLVTRLEEDLGVDVSVITIYETPTIRALGALLAAENSDAGAEQTSDAGELVARSRSRKLVQEEERARKARARAASKPLEDM